MGILHAAYCFGRNTRMVEFTVRYYLTFCGASEIQFGRNMRDCLHWIIDDLSALGPVLTDRSLVDGMRRDVGRLRNKLDVSRLPELEQATAVPGDVLDLARAVATAGRRMVRPIPALFPWFRLGDGVGCCFECLLDENRHRMPLAVDRLVRAAIALPHRRKDRISATARLAASYGRDESQPAMQLFGEAAGSPATSIEVERADAFVSRKVEKLDEVLRASFWAERDPAVLRITRDTVAGASVVLGAKAYPVSEHQATILGTIYRLQGRLVSTSNLMRKHHTLEEAAGV